MRELDDAAAGSVSAFIHAAWQAARAHTAWPDLRVLAGAVSAASPALHRGLGPAWTLDESSGLPPWELWSRLKADQRVAVEEGTPAESLASLQARASSSAAHDARLSRRRYHDALRALPALRTDVIDVALRSRDGGLRRLHVVLDKIEPGGEIVRLTADITVDVRIAKGLDGERLQDLLFPMASLPVELTLVRLLATRGVTEVERVTRGAMDVCATPVFVPSALEALVGIAGAAACALSFSTVAADITPGDNDLLAHNVTPLAALAREHLGGRALPHRVFRDRKLVVTPAAQVALKRLAEAQAKRTVFYLVPGGGP